MPKKGRRWERRQNVAHARVNEKTRRQRLMREAEEGDLRAKEKQKKMRGASGPQKAAELNCMIITGDKLYSLTPRHNDGS